MGRPLQMVIGVIAGLLLAGCADDWGVDQHGRKVAAEQLEGQWLVINYWAEWCGPCKALAPMVAELAETYKEQVIIAACDVEENNDIAVRYSIRNIPTVIFFKDGKEVGRQVGAIAKSVLEEKLKALL